MSKKIRSFFYPTLAFLSVFLIYFGIMLTAGYLKPGSIAFYETSLYQDILPYILAFLRVLKGEESLWYSFSVLWGSGTVGAYAAYAFSPFNLIYLCDGISLPLATCLICGLKLGLSALSFYFFISHSPNSEPKVSCFFSAAYALSSCLLLFSTRPMWLDACYMLPLLLLLIRRMVKTGDFFPMIPAFFYTAICCYTIFVPLIIFGFVVLMIMIIVAPFKEYTLREHIKYALKRFFYFIVSLLAAILLGAFLFLPLFYVIRDHAPASAAFPGAMTTLGDILSSLFFYETPGFSSAVPYLYCGIPALLLLPFYFGDPKRKLREKIGIGLLFAFYLIMMLFDPLWHITDPFTDGTIAYRFSFCITFLICTICADLCFGVASSFRDNGQIPHAGKLSAVQMFLIVSVSAMVFYALMLPVRELNGLTSDEARMFSRNAFLILLWIGVFLLLTRIRKKTITALPFLLLFIELFINGYSLFQSFAPTLPLALSEESILAIHQNASSVAETLAQDLSIYRVRIHNSLRINEGVASGFAATDSFAPYDSSALRQNLHYLGIAQDSCRICDFSAQELTDLLFGVKYSSDLSAGSIQANEYALPIAYAVSPSIEDYAPTYNPFINQYLILEKMTGNTYSFFSPVDPEKIESASFNLEHFSGGEQSYFVSSNDTVHFSRFTFSFPREGHEALLAAFYQTDAALRSATPLIYSQKNIPLYCTPCLSSSAVLTGSTTDEASFFTETDRFYLTLGVDHPPISGSYEESYITYYDSTEIGALYEDLAAGGLSITGRSEDSFTGTVCIPADRTVLFTSIPFDSGWDVYIDGKRSVVYPILNQAFCSLKLTPGTHEITMQYTAPGSTIGGLISMVTFLLFVLFGMIIYLRKKHASAPGEDSENE